MKCAKLYLYSFYQCRQKTSSSSPPATRRNSDGDVSLMESSTDGIEPGSPLVASSVDWSDAAAANSHIFVPTSSSLDSCYLAADCLHSGHRVKCLACRMISHQGCISTVTDRFPCRETFRECVRKYREQTATPHHWLTRRQVKGKCGTCAKTFHSKLGSKFSASSLGVVCSWCKAAYHKTDSCFDSSKEESVCDLGNHRRIAIPPSWIIKLPRKGSFKSSLKNSPKKTGCESLELVETVSKRRTDRSSHPTFLLKPIPSPNSCPVIGTHPTYRSTLTNTNSILKSFSLHYRVIPVYMRSV